LLIESLRPHAIVAAPAPMLTIYAEPQRLGGPSLLAAQARTASTAWPRRCRRSRANSCPIPVCSGRWTRSMPYCPARSAQRWWPRRRICR
jgi:hypothetical protein